jgi:CubicO group peptidase (beta-lactamase class C family)
VRMHAPRSVTFPVGGVGDITMQQLVTHTSGLPRVPMSAAFVGAMMSDADNPYKNYSSAELWKYLVAREHDATKTYPSEYSNLGMGLLGELLANRAGISFGELVARDITKPLGMTDTFIDVPKNEMTRFALGHTKTLKPVSYWDLPSLAGAGALRSTTRDMAKFIRAQIDGTLPGSMLSHKSLAKMGQQNDIGYAWLRLSARGDSVVWHNGGTGGFRSYAGFSEKSKRGVVVLENSQNGADDLARHFLNPAFRIIPPDEDERFGTSVAISIAITAIVALYAFLLPWRAKFVISEVQTNSTQNQNILRRAWHRISAAPQITSKWSAIALSAQIALITLLIALFGPWAALGNFVKWTFIVTIGFAAIGPLWRARALPMRAASQG